MEIYFVRHTTPLVDKGVCYGQTDLKLASSFSSELNKIKEKLPITYDAVYSSPLMRCHHLASALTDKPVLKDDRLMEINFGDWEMRSWNNIPKPTLDNWMKNFVQVSPPHGEAMLELQTRVLEWWEEIKEVSFDKIVVVTHAGVIRVLNATFNNIPLDQSFKDFKIAYGGIFTHSI